MDELKNFKKIADEELKKLSVTPELMNKTLSRCKPKTKYPIGTLALSAACLLLVIGVMNFSGPFEQVQKNTTENNPGILSTTMDAKAASWEPENIKEAKKVFGDALLTPGYIVEDFQLNLISAAGEKDKNASQIVLSYVNEANESYMIIQQKTALTSENRASKTIHLDGAIWYSVSSGNADLTTELTRYSSGVQYIISGQISETEAIQIAKSMK